MAMTELVRSAWKIIPQFHSRSINETVKFYTEELSFELGGVHPDDGGTPEPTFCSVFVGRKADANIYFFQTNAHEFQACEAMIALGTTELDEYYDRLKSGGRVAITEPIEDTEWGYRQFTIKDNDGNRLTFFKFLEGGNPGEE